MKVEQLVRYPVKGLGPEYLECVEVEKGGSIPCDRVFAIAHGATEFDAGSPVCLGKRHFLMLMRNPRLAAMRSADSHRFFDMPNELLSLINLQSIAELGRAVGAELDPIRFRGNVYVSGLGAWEEKRLVGSTIECGDLKFRVVQEISRCKATCVNPATAEVDVNVPFELRRNYDTLNMGLYLSVVRGGTIRAGQDLHFH